MRGKTIRDVFCDSASKYCSRKAISLIDSQTYTYLELYQRVLETSGKLSQINLQKGDKIALLSGNCPNWCISYLAIIHIGAVVVPILPDFTGKEVQNILEHSESKALIIAENLRSKVNFEELNFIETVVNIEDFSLQTKINQNITTNNATKINELCEIDENDLASIIYTSGTTGTSKGVMLTHKNIVWNIFATEKIQDMLPEDRLLSVLPLSHAYECTLGFLMPLFYGASIYYLGGLPTASVLIPAMQKVKPTMMLTVPLIIEKIYKSKIKPELTKGIVGFLYKLMPIRKILNKVAGKKLIKTFGGEIRFFGIGGAMLDSETEQFLHEAGFPYAIGYGLTETSPLIAGANPQKTKIGSTGFSSPDQQLKLININPLTGKGEIVAKGNHVMAGYYKNDELTQSVFTPDGWFKTGDLGYFDKKNRLFIKGRLKNMILGANGENIYPEEIEAILGRHNLVRDAIVYQLKGKLVAKVNLDYDEIEKRYNLLKEHARNMQSDLEQYITYILNEIHLYVNSEVNSFSKLAKLIEHPVPFEKTPTLKIKKYLYV